MIYLGLFLGFCGLLWLLQREAFDRGAGEKENEALRGELDDIHKANNIRDRLSSDPDYADRVRDRFTR